MRIFSLMPSVLLISLVFCGSAFAKRSAVTYSFNGGRLGDNLLAYSHAKWISYLYDIPLYYRPFEYSDQMMMHSLEQHLTQEVIASYQTIIDISQVASFTIEPDAGILYVIPYFPDSVIERANPRFFYFFPIGWQDKKFKIELKKMICPIKPLVRPDVPDNVFAVALHVRIGTGFDIPSLADYPKLIAADYDQLKCPPFSYYIQQLKLVLRWFANKNLYIYMFTDHTNPQDLVDYFEVALDHKVVIHTRNGLHQHNYNVLEDFFAMADSEYFDCIIRPDSNLSTVATRLADNQIQISPWHCSMINNEYVIDKICINNVTIQSTQSN
jgi:hypothetical protein